MHSIVRKRVFWSLAPCLALAACLGLLRVAPVLAEDVRVLQYNVKKAIGTFELNTNEQARAVGRIVNYVQPDILLLNEIQRTLVPANEHALIDWVTNNLPYMGTQPGSNFFVAVSDQTDNFSRNAAISVYPIQYETTFDDGLRGLHSFEVQLSGTNRLHVFHAHFKSGNTTNSTPTDAQKRQANAQFAADTISAWAASNSIPYVFAGDCNVDEDYSQTPIDENYHPITTLFTAGLADFEPTDLNGNSKTISTATASPTRRYDYVLSNTNRLAPTSGYVFSTVIWSQHGLYTNTSGNFPTDSIVAADHYPVLATYHFASEPAHLDVAPIGGLNSIGNRGGPFAPSMLTFEISNIGDEQLEWSASTSRSWVSLSVTNGTLPPQTLTSIDASINGTANLLAPGVYSNIVTFVNVSNGNGDTSRLVVLSVTSTVSTVFISTTDASASEPGTNSGRFSVLRTLPTNLPLSVNYTLGGTATPGIDYSNLTGTVIIPKGKTSANIPIKPLNDGAVECPETIVATLSSSPSYAIGAPGSASITITDNDLPSVTIAATDPNASEPGPNTGRISVTRTGCTNLALRVDYTVSGTATPGSDYTALSGKVSIPAGKVSAVITVKPLDDATPEPVETVVVTLSPTSRYVVAGQSNATVSITSNE